MKCPPPKLLASSINICLWFPHASCRKTAQSISSLETPSWHFGARLAASRILPRQRTAIAIRHALAADNQCRVAEGLEPIRIRMGIHMGPVVVGDIGTPNRINYTIVGDAVNATQRLESLGKDVDPDAEAIVLVSADVVVAAPGFRFVERGTHLVKGKQQSLDVYQLTGKSDADANKAQ